MRLEEKTEADKYAEKGVNLANNGDLDGAIEAFKKSLSLTPNAQVFYF